MTTRQRQRDEHSAMVEQWLDQVLADPATTRMDFSVAWAVAMHFNRSSNTAWAAVDKYAKRCHTDRRTVQRSLRRLESAGHLAAIKGGGRKVTNRYQPVLKNSGAGAAVSDTENSGADAAVSAPDTPQKGGRPAPKHPKTAVPVPPNLLKRTAESESSLEREDDRCRDQPRDRGGAPVGAPRPADEAAFQTLRKIWARGHAKDDTPDAVASAWRAFLAAIASGASPDQILDAARLHVAAADKPRFLPKLEDWLIARGYEKPPPRPKNKQPRGGRASKSAARAMAALVISED